MSGQQLVKVSKDGNTLVDLVTVLNYMNAEDFTKAASPMITDRLVESIRHAKADGNEVNIHVPVKLAFSDEDAREGFMSLGKIKTAADVKQAAVAPPEPRDRYGRTKSPLTGVLQSLFAKKAQAQRQERGRGTRVGAPKDKTTQVSEKAASLGYGRPAAGNKTRLAHSIRYMLQRR